MKIIFLAAGEGKRLRPLIESLPKCMVRINGIPIMEHNIRWAVSLGFQEIFINLYYMGDIICNYFGSGEKFGATITYLFEDVISGTAGGVKGIAKGFDDSFCVWYGDNLSNINLQSMREFHKAQGGTASIGVFLRKNTSQSGVVTFDRQYRINGFLEKPEHKYRNPQWVNSGIYMFEPGILKQIPDEIPSDFGRDIFPKMIKSNISIYAYQMGPTEKLWWIDTPEDYQFVMNKFFGK